MTNHYISEKFEFSVEKSISSLKCIKTIFRSKLSAIKEPTLQNVEVSLFITCI